MNCRNETLLAEYLASNLFDLSESLTIYAIENQNTIDIP